VGRLGKFPLIANYCEKYGVTADIRLEAIDTLQRCLASAVHDAGPYHDRADPAGIDYALRRKVWNKLFDMELDESEDSELEFVREVQHLHGVLHEGRTKREVRVFRIAKGKTPCTPGQKAAGDREDCYNQFTENYYGYREDMRGCYSEGDACKCPKGGEALEDMWEHASDRLGASAPGRDKGSMLRYLSTLDCKNVVGKSGIKVDRGAEPKVDSGKGKKSRNQRHTAGGSEEQQEAAEWYRESNRDAGIPVTLGEHMLEYNPAFHVKNPDGEYVWGHHMVTMQDKKWMNSKVPQADGKVKYSDPLCYIGTVASSLVKVRMEIYQHGQTSGCVM